MSRALSFCVLSSLLMVAHSDVAAVEALNSARGSEVASAAPQDLSTQSPDNPSAKAIELSLDASGDVRWDDETDPLDRSSLSARLTEAHRRDETRGVILRAEAQTSYQRVVELVELCQRIGIVTFRFNGDAGPEPTFEAQENGFRPLFNGRDLSGWEGQEDGLWIVEDGMIVGRSPGIAKNQFLATREIFKDFVLRFQFRLVGGEGNSGVQFRSIRVLGHEMSGYQADIGEGYWSCLYDESRRNRVLIRPSQEALDSLDTSGWNTYELTANGASLTLRVNGVTAFEYEEEDSEIAREGRIALQVHSGGPMEIQFKDLQIRELD